MYLFITVSEQCLCAKLNGKYLKLLASDLAVHDHTKIPKEISTEIFVSQYWLLGRARGKIRDSENYFDLTIIFRKENRIREEFCHIF